MVGGLLITTIEDHAAGISEVPYENGKIVNNSD